MKNMFKSLLVGVGVLACVNSQAASTITVVVQPGTMTNILSNLQSGAAIVRSFTLAANGTNAAVVLYDTPTNQLVWTNVSYISSTSYATNYILTWTNFMGATNSWTNLTLVDITNTVTGSSNNVYAARISGAALASTTTIINPLYTVFENGIWATNTSSGVATVTIQFLQ